MCNITLEKCLKLLEWVFFLGLCIISIFFMQEVLRKYTSNATSFTQEKRPLTEQPTITICFKPYDHNFTLGKDFNITYFYYYNLTQKVSLELKSGNNYNVVDNETVILQEMTTYFSGVCQKINIESKFFPRKSKFVGIDFEKSIPNENIPELKVFITSEGNAYGIVINRWMDGETLEVDISKSFLKQVSLRSKKTIQLKSISVCSEESFYQCFERKLFEEYSFDNCPSKCSPVTLPSSTTINHPNKIPQCQNEMERECAQTILSDYFFSMNMNECSSSCSILQFKGKIVHEVNINNNHTIQLAYSFGAPEFLKLYQEYLVYDTINMFGSVGGTLGLLFGFSFTNVIAVIIQFIQKLRQQFLEKFK